jgi:predicted nuclease of predicted toxin-antitoxin system
MAWADANGRVVLTGDLDFGAALARSRRNRPSVVQLRTRDTLPAHVGPTVLEELREAQDQLQSGALLTIGSRRNRLKRLPFRN